MMDHTLHIVRRAAIGLLLLLMCSGCAFERQWRATCDCPCTGRDLAGCWEGTWQSEMNGHHGGLRAVITDQGAGVYDAHFKATFAVVIPYEFQMSLLVADDGTVYTFEGQEDLGLLAGGVYTYRGTASATDFLAHYCASGNGDHGTFSMSKLCPGQGECCGACGNIPRSCGAMRP